MQASRVLILLLLILTGFGCRDNSATGAGKKARGDTAPLTANVISNTGTYYSVSGQYELQITIANGIVHYAVRSADTGGQLFVDNAGSDYSRWYFVWADDDTLWVYSGDLGSAVWEVKSGKWTRHGLTLSSPFLKRMPRPFYDNMGSSLRDWYAHRISVDSPSSQPNTSLGSDNAITPNTKPSAP
jgi:hypothetical protein